MAKPTKQDARLLLQCAAWFTSSGVADAMNWVRSDAFTDDAVEFNTKHPFGSEGRLRVATVLGFYETVGTLWKQRLIDEGLLFDWLWIPGSWDEVANVARGMRAASGTANLWANFEAMAERQRAIAAKAAAKAQATTAKVTKATANKRTRRPAKAAAGRS
jgi:hypothetical protein